MNIHPDVVASLTELSSVFRGSTQALVQLDITRCLIFLRYASSGALRLGRERIALEIPSKAQWSYLRDCHHDLAEMLGQACQKLEEANPALDGTLTEVDFRQVERWDSERQDRLYARLIESASKLPNLQDAGQVGELYDLLVTTFAQNAGKTGEGQLFLSVPVARLMVELLHLEDGGRVCDPVCRAGRTLVACVERANMQRFRLTLHGQDSSEKLCAISKTSLLLHGADDVRIETGDVLHSPKLTDESGLLRYERVIAAPPVNRDNWGAEDAAEDRFRRFPIVPPKQSADYAYILHCLSIMEDDGRAVILTGLGVLFRQGAEEPIRRMLLQNDHFDAIVGLPEKLLYGTHIASALLVLRKGKTPHRGKVLFYQARGSAERRARHEALGAEEIDAIARCVRRFEDMPGVARVVSLEEIEHRQWVLSPAAYITREGSHTDLDLAARLDAIQQTEAERDEAASRVDGLIRQLAEQLGLQILESNEWQGSRDHVASSY